MNITEIGLMTTSTKVLQIMNWQTLLKMHQEDTVCALTRWQNLYA